MVERIVESVLKQSYSSYEIIVVDDGSTDNSREILREIKGSVQIIWQENKGLAGARNSGILAASGEFIGLLDADDEWLSSYLETMMVLAVRRQSVRFGHFTFIFCARRLLPAQNHR